MGTRRFVRFGTSLSVAVLAFARILASAVAPPQTGLEEILRPAHVAGEVLIKFKPAASPAVAASYRVQFGAQTLARFRAGGERWRLGAGHTEADVIAALRSHPLVAYVEPNYTVSIDRTPNDPRYGELYGLNNTGQNGGIPGADIDAERAWEVSTGSSDVVVGVIDTGVDYNHPELSANIWANPGEIPANGQDDDANGYVDDVRGWDFYNHDNDPMDDHSHGTHVSGTIGAVGDNGIGIVGVAWNVKIVPLKFLGWDGYGSTSDAILAVEYATAAHVDVLNNSWGGGGFSQGLLDAIEAASDAGILFVAAAGNASSDNDAYPHYPSSYDAPNIVSVAATGRYDELAYFSNWGATTVDLGAPGVETLSCLPGNSYGTKSGTSMATPHVSGVAALIRAVAPGIDVVHLKAQLLAAVDPDPALVGNTVTGGRINAFLAIATPDTTPPGSVSDLSVTGSSSNSLLLAWTATGDDGDDGTANFYEIRWSDQLIDAGNFPSATLAAGAPPPAPAGQPQSAELVGLAPGQSFYVAMIARDEWGNAGPVSNIASGATLPPPTFASSPASFELGLLTGGSDTRVLTLMNAGVGTLDWTIDDPGQAGTAWLSVAPRTGRLGAGAQIQVTLAANATGLDGGVYAAAVDVRTNDPGQPLVSHPVTLTVTGAPDLGLLGEEVVLTSTQSYATDGGFTNHALPVASAPSGGGTLELVAEGDYGDIVESATAIAEGVTIGSVGATGLDCTPAQGTFPIAPTTLVALAADGVVNVLVDNTSDVGVFCAPNQHTVTLRFRGPADALAFEPLFVGASEQRTLIVENRGTDMLEVSEISAGLPEFTLGAAAMSVPAHTSQPLVITFTPSSAAAFDTTLTLTSNDPDTPVTAVPLTGTGVEPPVIVVAPTSLQSTLNEGADETQTLTISNTGGSPLAFSIVTARAARAAGVAPLAAQFEPLASSPVALTCVVADAAAGYVYAQANSGYGFYRYDAEANAWQTLAQAPVHSGNNGGAALLDGKIYTVYTSTSQMGVYDIATDSWTVRPSPGYLTTANIASDGTQRLYLVGGWTSLSYDPATGATTSLASPPFYFEAWGGLVWSGDVIRGHQGSGTTGFASYDPATGSWTPLPSVPGPTVLGAAIDPFTGDYFAVGGYEGHNLYRYDALAGSWSVETIPNFPVNDGGMGWLGFPVPGIVFVQGQSGTGFQRLAIDSAGISVDPRLGTVAPGASASIDVHFDARGIAPAIYDGLILVRSNDPLHPRVDVATSFTVIGRPDIALEGEATTVESAVGFTTSGAATAHVLAVTDPPYVPATVELLAEGDYGDISETATATAEGTTVGTVGSTGTDCTPADGLFALTAADFARLAADGVVHVTVQNSAAVDTFCEPNRHTVRLSWRSEPDLLDFGALFVGGIRTRELSIRNDGSITLHVTSVTIDDTRFMPSFGSVDIAPHDAATLVVTFAPTVPEHASGTLTIVSDDPDEGVVTVPLMGDGLIAPDIAVSPASFDASLLTGEAVTRTLAIDNTGGSDLTWDAGTIAALSAVRPAAGPGAATTGRALVIQDSLPWGYDSNQRVLTANGIPFDVVSSAALPGTTLSDYALVIVPSEQSVEYYTTLAAEKSRIDAYVAGGGRLEVHASSYYGYAGLFVLPGGVTITSDVSTYNHVLLPWHPFVTGLPADIYGNSASHSAFAGVPASAFVVANSDHGAPTLIDYRFGVGAVAASGQTLEYYFANGGEVGPILPNMIAYTWSRTTSWVRVAPESGTLPPGGHADLTVTIDASGMFGGDFDAAVAISSNDPDEGNVQVPVHLHVTAAPDIVLEPASIDFGDAFVGYPASQALTIRNDGTATLHVGPMTVSGAGFSLSATELDVPIGGASVVTVTFDPGSSGTFGGTITIPTNDPDQPEVAVPLTGAGLVPPDIDVSPAELHEREYEDRIITRTLTLTNLGGSDLTWTLGVQRGAASAAEVMNGAANAHTGASPSGSSMSAPAGYHAVASEPRFTAGSRVLLVQDYYPWDSAANEWILQANALPFDRVTTAGLGTIDLSVYRLVIVSSDQPTSSYTQIAAHMGRLSDFVATGGVLEFHAAGFGWNSGDPTGIVFPDGMRVEYSYAYSNHVADPSHPVMAGVGEPITGTTVSLGHFTALPAGASVIATDDVFRPTLVEYRHGAGLVVATCHTLEYLWEYGYVARRILENLIPYAWEPWPLWLSVDPTSGVLASGAATPLTVTIDTSGVPPGDYVASIVFASNDPDEAAKDVAVTLHVIGVPRIVVAPDRLDFGPVFIGGTKTLPLLVTNPGTDALEVSSVTAGDPSVAVDATSFTLAPGGSRELHVSLTPTSTSPIDTAVTIVSNDPDAGTVIVPLTGSGIVAPDIVVSPDALDASLLTGEVVQRSLAIDNVGGSDLTWSAAVTGAAGAGAATTGRALLIQDYSPWGSYANEAVLQANGIAYDTIPSWLVSGTTLSSYKLVIVASAQSPSFYSQLATQKDRIDAYVAAGGRLEFHGMDGYGYAAAFVLPSGTTISLEASYADSVQLPLHPLAAGLPSVVYGSAASYSVFGNLPANAQVVMTNEYGRPTLVEYRSGAGLVVASGQTLEYYHYYGGSVGLILDNMVPYAWNRLPSWLRLDPTSGTVPAAGHTDLAVTLDATGLPGGDYDAVVELASNDPDEAIVSRPVHMHVTGAADIEVEPGTLDFGVVFTGYGAERELTILNLGTDVLHVDSITIDDPAYVVDTTAFDLPIGATITLGVLFSPTAAGPHDATLTIVSDDPDEAAVAVELLGSALVPPVVTLTPGEFHEALYSGQTVTRTLTLGNTGGSDLTWSLRAWRGVTSTAAPASPPTQPAGAPPAPTGGAAPAWYRPVPSEPRVMGGSRVLLLQDVAPWGVFSNESVLQANALPYDRLTTLSLPSIDLSAYHLVIVASDQPGSAYARIAANMPRLSAFVAGGGVLEFHAAGNGYNGGDPSSVVLPGDMGIRFAGAQTNHVADPTHPIMNGVPEPFTGNGASHGYFTSLPAGAHVIATDDVGRANLVEYTFGAGLVVAGAQTLEYYRYYGGPIGLILSNMIPYAASASPGWLSVTPLSGTIPAGGSGAVAVTFDPAGLQPGEYAARLTVATNDPLRPDAAVPVTLHVRGAPQIVVSPGSLDFGEIFVGGQSQRLLEISNIGTDVLNVSSIAGGDPAISVDTPSLTLGVGESRQVIVTFHPAVAVTLATTITILSDDPDEGTAEIPLTGSAAIPPHVVMEATDLEVTILSGESATRTVTVRNTGGSDLSWNLHVAPGATIDPRPPAAAGTQPTANSIEPPAGFHPLPAPPHVGSGARVLIVEDNAPWASTANEQILAANGLSYTIVSTTLMPYVDLSEYGLIIVSSDQGTDTYVRLAGLMNVISPFVAAGGVLEFHAAGWGWYGGDPRSVILPGGMMIGARISNTNHVVMPEHPVMAGVPEPFIGSAASHAYFTHLTAGAVVIGADDAFQPNLVEYPFGAGRVIASGHTLEISYDYHAIPGTILANMIPWAANLSGGWLSIPVKSGIVPAGGQVDIEIRYDATRVPPNEYEETLALSSNDPAQPVLQATARLQILRLRADAGAEQRIECSGGGGAIAVLDGSGSVHMDGPEAITRYGWSENGQALGDGALFAVPLPKGAHEIALRIEDVTGDFDDDLTQVEVVDTLPPAGTITSPPALACFGPPALPVVVSDNFGDSCGGGVVRVYDPPGAGSVSAHGDHVVTLRASDTDGNAAAPVGVAFTVDTAPPSVTIVATLAGFQLPQIVPFPSLFTSGDDDGASGGVVHEVVAVDGCVVYDGATYGDQDGLLSDESVTAHTVPLCDIARACGRRHWTDPVITVTATDCGGNATTASIVAPGQYLAAQCAPATTLAVTRASGAARLSWSPVAGASAYQVVRGSLGVLRGSGGIYHAATEACLASAAASAPVDDPVVPAPGTGSWYLVRDVTEGVRGSWDEYAPRQFASRDGGIDTSAAACP